MKVIYKEQLSITNHQIISLPMDSKILTVQMQKESVCLWYSRDATSAQIDCIDRHIRIIGTGNLYDDEGLKYIGTVQMAGGNLIWHVFEELEDKVKLLEEENKELKEEIREEERDPDSRTWGR